MKIKDLIEYGRNNLSQKEEPYKLSKMILKHLLKVDDSYLVINQNLEINKETIKEYYKEIEILNNGTPIQYITNNQEFMKLNFYVDKNVLIPQPDTEMLVEKVLNIYNKNYKDKINISILDLCTGSGAIAIALAKNIEEKVNIYGSDISYKALKIANLNKKNNSATNVNFIQSNMFENIRNIKFDIIVSNPPYIKTEIINKLDPEVRKEPHIALDGGNDGLNFYRIIVNNSYNFLNEKGYICLEIGYDQKNDVIKLINDSKKYEEIETIKDLAGNDRCIIARKNFC